MALVPLLGCAGGQAGSAERQRRLHGRFDGHREQHRRRRLQRRHAPALQWARRQVHGLRAADDADESDVRAWGSIGCRGACSARRAAPVPASPSPRTAPCSRTTGCAPRACPRQQRLPQNHLPRRHGDEGPRRLRAAATPGRSRRRSGRRSRPTSTSKTSPSPSRSRRVARPPSLPDRAGRRGRQHGVLVDESDTGEQDGVETMDPTTLANDSFLDGFTVGDDSTIKVANGKPAL